MAKPSTTPELERTASPEVPDSGRKSYNHPCVIAQALGVLGDRWTLLILRDLMSGLNRYSDILENCGGMSPNVLSDRLKRLEADGLVQRTYHRELPPRVDYTLTEKGWAVRPILLSLISWGQQYLQPMELASVGTDVPTDFAVRVVPAFWFQADRAGDLTASMAIEITDCPDCNTWSFEINEGRIHPRRRLIGDADIRLVATTQGFFRFLRGEAPPEECGQLEGSAVIAAAIQGCFLSR
jgi:DNA-binding HxlR family transcriptional regulator